MDTYQDMLSALERGNPQHPLLRIFNLLRTEANMILLESEVSKLPAPAEPPGQPMSAQAVVDLDEPIELTHLHRQQSTLFGERRKLSNIFHECFTDRQRADVSKRIQVVQLQIEHVRGCIDHFKSTGQMPVQDERYPIPKDPFELLALERSLMSSLSRKSNQIRQLGLDLIENVTGAEDRLKKAEKKYSELQKHLEHVRKAKTLRNLQPGAIPESGQAGQD